MRTTLDLPDELFKKAKLKAVGEGVPLKVIVTRALEKEVIEGVPDMAMRRERAKKLFAAMNKLKIKGPVGRLNREELYDRPVLRRQ